MLKRLLLALSLSLPALAVVAQNAPTGSAPTARVIVKFKATADTVRARSLSARADAQTAAQVLGQRASLLSARVGVALKSGSSVGTGVQVVTATGIGSAELAAKLAADPDVEYAEIDQRAHRLALPGDPLYATVPLAQGGPVAGQWYLKPPSVDTPASINAEQAWDLTKGSSTVVVAVLDTGVRPNHPDLAGKLVMNVNGKPGWDMVADVPTANDGDGRDDDASDPGDGVTAAESQKVEGCVVYDDQGKPTDQPSSWHGTLVTGIVGAATDNSVGVASVGWNVKVLPVRVLGKCGGLSSDIAAGILWAAGIHVDGVPDNTTPAKVINLSLGSANACSKTYQSAISEAIAAGVTVVAAAGNDGLTVGQPANCAGVIAVTGLRHAGTKSGFADLGPAVAIAAPGGNCVSSEGSCIYPLVSTTDTGTSAPGTPTYSDGLNYEIGTSFSSPMVAATAGLMLSVRPELTPTEVKSALQATARPFPQSGGSSASIPACTAPDADPASSSATAQLECYCTTSTCGAGMLDVRAAIEAVGPVSVQASIAPASTSVTAGQNLSLAISNATPISGVTYAWTVLSGANVVSLSGAANGPSVTLVGQSAGSATVRLTVSDAVGHSAASDVAVTVAAAPVTGGGGTGGGDTGGGGGGGAFSPLWLALLALATVALGRRRPNRRG